MRFSRGCYGSAGGRLKMLKKRGWDVEYGIARNIATDISEFGQEQRLQSLFADDFMICLSETENE